MQSKTQNLKPTAIQPKPGLGFVLVVDDEEQNRSLLRDPLEARGYEIAEAENGLQALQKIAARPPDVILLDLMMPKMDGFEVCRRLKKDPKTAHIPILMVTALSERGDRLMGIQAGANDFLNKPIDIQDVILRVGNAVYAKHLHDQLLEQFIQAQKMEVLGQLASGVAHDFNNIIAVIMGYGNLIMAELGADSPLRKYAEQIRHATERATGLTRQLLAFSRKQMVQPVVLDLNAVVKDLDEILRRLIGENIEMMIVPGKQIGRIKADAGHVGQVLMNLAVNARDAMPVGGQLTIATHNVTLDENHPGAIPGDYVMLSVSDTGAGMTDEVKARLFEPFFTTKPLGKGTGLGLAICQTIVQQSGGHIGVDSEVGKGTTFKIYFPRVEQPPDVAARPIQAGPLPRGTETLLVVEDEPAVRHLACSILEAQGYTVLCASNGQEGLRAVREYKGSPIRLVVTDVIMPLMGGKVMTEWLKTTHPGLKILFTSGYMDDTVAQLGVLDAGVEFLAKPYTPATLARKVREVLDQPSAPKPELAQKTFGFTKISDKVKTPEN
jgi:two-component system cell cycle sensor histidine kinase/response regulator CckA